MKQTMKNVGLLAVALTAAAVLGACSKSDDEQQQPDPVICPVDPEIVENLQPTRTEETLISGSNDFAFNLLRQTQEEGVSQILSPISITYALGMLNNGAAGETQKQIEQVLGFGDTGADAINAFCQKMLYAAPALDPLTKVMISNNIYVNEGLGYQLNPDFVSKAHDYYFVDPEARDFADGKTLDVINQWASDHTEKMIEKVLSEEEFSPSAVSYLLNAIYFKGTWTSKFEKSETKNEDFYPQPDPLANGVPVKVPMMHQVGRFSYGEFDGFKALSLPYGNESYQMTLLLPTSKSLSEVIQSLNGEEMKTIQEGMFGCEVDVKLPSFETKSDVDLKDVMSALGMPLAFDEFFAEFPYFANVGTYICLMKQVARIKLNEEGSEAAAVTVIGMEKASMAPSEPLTMDFHADHPFLYVITEKTTGAIFFIGTYWGR